MSTVLWMFLIRNVISFSERFTKTVILSAKEMTRFFIMTVVIITLKLNRKTVIENTEKAKSTDQIQMIREGL